MSKGLPGIPPVPANVDAATRQWMEAMSEALSIQAGQRGDPLDRSVTVRELGESGVAQVQSVGRQSVAVVAPPSEDLGSDQTLPSTPANFVAHANPRSVVLTWSKHQQTNIAHAEVYRSATNVLGDAVLVGVSPGQSYPDTDIATGQTWFYWLRYMSYAANPGAWYSLTPVEVTVPALSGDEIADLDVDKLVGNTATFVQANINEGSITNAMIGNEIKSDGFVAGQTGWRVDKSGNAEFNNLQASGDIVGAYIRGSIIEGSLFIKESNDLLIATEADQGFGTTRYLAFPQDQPNTRSESRPGTTDLNGVYSHEAALVSAIASADFNRDGVVFDDASQQDVYANFSRYRYFTINPKIKVELRDVQTATFEIDITVYGIDGVNKNTVLSHRYIHQGMGVARNEVIPFGSLRTTTKLYSSLGQSGPVTKEGYAWIDFSGLSFAFKSPLYDSIEIKVRITRGGELFDLDRVAYIFISDASDEGF